MHTQHARRCVCALFRKAPARCETAQSPIPVGHLIRRTSHPVTPSLHDSGHMVVVVLDLSKEIVGMLLIK